MGLQIVKNCETWRWLDDKKGQRMHSKMIKKELVFY